jgi:quercetin dioxygenase-like cupin family protein
MRSRHDALSSRSHYEDELHTETGGLERRSVDRDRFEERLKAERYPDIRTNELPPNRRHPEHSHPFDVLALVLEGEISLTVEGRTRTYRAGDEFAMKAGCPHAEDIGPAGVRYLVGRRPT